jgi:hypothetical protein
VIGLGFAAYLVGPDEGLLDVVLKEIFGEAFHANLDPVG